jgi:FkbM family methyltransferase
VSRHTLRKRLLRGIRGSLAAALAWTIAAIPALEAPIVRACRGASRRSRLFSGLYWFMQERLIARLKRGGERFRPVTVRGRRLQLDITDPTGRYPFFYGTPYEPAVTDAIATALRPGDVFVDIGANIGYFAVLAAQCVGGEGHVVAFEPHEGARDALDVLVQRNEVVPAVEIVPVALADADGSATLFVEDAITAHSTLEPSLSPMRHVAALHAGSVVQVTTLDGWLASRRELAARIRCIKIDVEGAEARVLAGMAETLRFPSLTIVCETSTGSRADEMLAAAGFERRRIEPGASSYGNFLYVRS